MSGLLLPRNNKFHYSDWVTWKSSKETYRKRFFVHDHSLKSEAIKFGAMIARLMEEDPFNPLVADIPRFECPEFKLDPIVEGVEIETHPDSFSLDPKSYLAFKEYKTALVNSKGSWSKKKVLGHDQLVFYAWATYHKYGTYNPDCELIEIPTEREVPPEKVLIDGVLWDNPVDKIRMPINRARRPDGSYVPVNVFPRHITKIEIDSIHTHIISSARMVSGEYSEFVNRLIANI